MTEPNPAPPTAEQQQAVPEQAAADQAAVDQAAADEAAAEQAAAEQAAAEEEKAGRRGKNPSAEAARYRQELRAAETERDTLRSRLDRYQRNEVGRLAEKAGATRGDDIADVTDLATLLGEDGEVDPEKVAARIADLRAERPHWFAPGPRTRPRELTPAGGRRREVTETSSGPAPANWGQLLQQGNGPS